MDRKQETKAVKAALQREGYNLGLQVKHGRGTSWGWLSIHADIERVAGCECFIRKDLPTERCEGCKMKWRENFNRINEIDIMASGRNKYSAKNINVHLGFFGLTIQRPLRGAGRD